VELELDGLMAPGPVRARRRINTAAPPRESSRLESRNRDRAPRGSVTVRPAVETLCRGAGRTSAQAVR